MVRCARRASAATGAIAGCALIHCDGTIGLVGALLLATVGGGIGLVAAHIVDVSVLSYEERRPRLAAPVVGWRAITLVPSLELRKERMFLGVQGTF